MAAGEIIFEVREDETEGGYLPRSPGYSIFTDGRDMEELRRNVKEATDCHCEDVVDAPKIIRLHFVRDEVLAR